VLVTFLLAFVQGLIHDSFQLRRNSCPECGERHRIVIDNGIHNYLVKFALEGFITDVDPDFGYRYITSNVGSLRLGDVILGPAVYFKFGVLLF
ncbi:MAG: hypothetical protein IH946_06115, partial [Bacteroidetes bacterium]|nr:hypothetical protein [Bacteroidota bacterium]